MRRIDQGNAVVVVLDANYSAFDEAVIEETQDELLTIVEERQPPRIVLDFSETEYFSSVFFEVLFRVWKRVQERGGFFAIAGLKPACHEIMVTAKLDTLWPIYPDWQSALAEEST